MMMHLSSFFWSSRNTLRQFRYVWEYWMSGSCNQWRMSCSSTVFSRRGVHSEQEILLEKIPMLLLWVTICTNGGIQSSWARQEDCIVRYWWGYDFASCLHNRECSCICNLLQILVEAAANGTPTSTFTFGITAPAVFDKLAVVSTCTYNKCKQVHVLAEWSVSGMHRESFDLSQESEREKLQRFLYFLGAWNFLSRWLFFFCSLC